MATRIIARPMQGLGALALMFPTVVPSAEPLQFFANGEALAVEGFVAPELTRDGWELRFDHIYVTLAEISALQTDPPFNPGGAADPEVRRQVSLPGSYTVDLVQDADADGRVPVGAAMADPGHYNALSWRIVPAVSGPSAGSSMVLIGTATRDGVQVPFDLRYNAAKGYLCGEFVGDERKGFVTEDTGADVEMTLHLDHVFGRADRSADDPMNQSALGFDPFAASVAQQAIILDGLHIGHVGEGHCRLREE